MPIDAWTVIAYLNIVAILLGLQALLSTSRRPPRPRFPDAPEGPRCQACGYILYRDATTCPECGATRRALPANSRPPFPPIPGILALAVVLFPATVALGYPIATRFPSLWRATGKASYTGLPRSADIFVYARGRGDARRIEQVWVHFDGNPRLPPFAVSLDRMTIHSADARLRPPPPLDADTLVHYLAPTRRDNPDPAAVWTAQWLVDEIQSLRDNRWLDDRFSDELTGHALLQTDDASLFWLPTYTPWCVPPWLALTALASRPLLRHHRRQTKAGSLQ